MSILGDDIIYKVLPHLPKCWVDQNYIVLKPKEIIALLHAQASYTEAQTRAEFMDSLHDACPHNLVLTKWQCYQCMLELHRKVQSELEKWR